MVRDRGHVHHMLWRCRRDATGAITHFVGMPTFTPAAPGVDGGRDVRSFPAAALAKSKSCSDLMRTQAGALGQPVY